MAKKTTAKKTARKPREKVADSEPDIGSGTAREAQALSNDRCQFPAQIKALSCITEDRCKLGFSVAETDLSIERAHRFLVESCLEVTIKIDEAGEADAPGQKTLIDTKVELTMMVTCMGFSFGSKPGRIVSAFTFDRESSPMAKLLKAIKKRAIVSLVYASEASE